MNDTNPNRQFSIAKLAEWTAIAALLIALTAEQSDLSLLFTSLLASAVVAFKSWRMGLPAIAIGAFTGFSLPAASIFGSVLSTVLNAKRDQGHLYCEDGPAIFFFGSVCLLVIFGGLFSLLGAVAGATFHLGRNFCTKTSGKQRR